MSLSVAALSATLQPLFTHDADQLAHDCHAVQRRRKLTGAVLARTLVFGWLDDPQAPFDALADSTAASAQALHARLTPATAEFLRQLLNRAVGSLVAARGTGPGLLARFSSVSVEDCTYLRLPLELVMSFPGCGSERPSAGMKLYTRWDLVSGRLEALRGLAGRTSDRTARPHTALPAGALRLADLGFYDGPVLRADTAAGVGWVTRLPTRVSVRAGGRPFEPLAEFLGRPHPATLDAEVVAGLNEPVPGRLLAWRCPPAVRRVRLARLRKRAAKLGRPVSAAQRRLCGWTVLFTNLPAQRLSAGEAWVLYRARWQVELLFRRWKSQGGLGRWHSGRGSRVLCELYAKLLGQVVAGWAELVGGGPLVGTSPTRRRRRVQRRARSIGAAIGSRRQLRGELNALRRVLRRLRPATRRRRLTTAQLLAQPTRGP